MGNYRFKLSDMIPNSWIYKLRDMGKGNNNPTNTCHNKNRKQTLLVSASPTQFQPRKSYYFTRELPPTDGFYISPPQQPESHHFPHLQLQPPRKSSKQRRRRRGATINGTSSPRRPVTSPVSAGCNCRTTLESVWTKSDISPPQELLSSSSTSPTNFASSRVFRTDRVLTTDHQESFDAMVSLSRDVVIDVNQKSLETKPKLDADHALHDHNSLFDLQLAPIITKPLMFNDMLNDIKKLNEPKEALGKMETETVTKKAPDASVAKIRKEAGAETAVTGKKERSLSPGVRKFGVNSQVGGVRLRIHSPRVGSRKTSNHIQGRVKNINSSSSNATSTSNKMGRRRRSSSSNSSCGSSSTASSKEPRKKLSESFAVMKSSYDPQRDFRESMVEMIIENNIRGSKDLEDLLACYLCLNADEYHHLIIKVFKQIWFDLTVTDVRTK